MVSSAHAGGRGCLLAALLLAGPIEAATPYEAAMRDPLDDAGRRNAVADAARLGDGAAQFALSEMLDAGFGGPRDPAAAARWRLLAAGPARSDSQFALGMRYLTGDGVSQDSGRAGLWLEEAARRGHAGAQVMLAGMMARGDGVAADRERSMQWLTTAARRGSAEAQFRLARELGMPAGEGWLRRAAASGHPAANRQLGVELAAGGGLPTDEVAARVALERSADAGDSTAMLLAGFFHADARGGPRDPERAYYWLRRATLTGDDRGAERLAALGRELSLAEQVSGDVLARGAAAPPVIAGAPGGQVLPAAHFLGHGTGFWLGGSTSVLVTNAHVIEQCGEVRLPDGAVLETLAAVDHVDLAVLAAPSVRRSGLALAPAPRRGAAVRALLADGAPVSGTVKALERPGHDRRYFRFDARLEQGASGGPVIDDSDRVVGVTVARLTPGAAFELTGRAGEPAAFAVRADVVAAFLDAHGIRIDGTGSTVADPAAAVTRVECWF